MNYRVTITLLVPYFCMMLLGTISQMAYTQAGATGELTTFLSEGGNPDLIVFDSPKISSDASGIQGVLQSSYNLANVTFDAFTSLIRMGTLDFDFFDQHPFFTIVRFVILFLWVPFILQLAMDLMKVLSGVFRF
jgi:hypothetical protein|tara:strand:- start:10399 stop:10800 length:402 start_codon:yes stop_codon:yes gene_type:complete